jgi:hypothetical protein
MKKASIFLVTCILLLFLGNVMADDDTCGIDGLYWEYNPRGYELWPLEYNKYCFKNCDFRLFSIICYKKRIDC